MTKENSTWIPPVLKTEATKDKGEDKLIENIQKDRKYNVDFKGGLNLRKRKNSIRTIPIRKFADAGEIV